MFIYRTYDENSKNLASTKLLARAVLGRAFMDAVGHITNSSYCGATERSLLKKDSIRFIDSNNKWFVYWCDMAELEPDYVVRKFDDLIYHFNSGKMKGLNLQTLIETYISRL